MSGDAARRIFAYWPDQLRSYAATQARGIKKVLSVCLHHRATNMRSALIIGHFYFTTTTRILQGFTFLCKFRLLSLKRHRDYQI